MDEVYIAKLTSDHARHLRLCIHASIEDKSQHLRNLSIVWRELKNLKATSEAHIYAVNYAVTMGRLGYHWQIARNRLE